MSDDEQRPFLRRAGTNDPPDLKLWERPSMEALESSPRPSAFAFHLSALRFRPGPSGAQYSIAVEVPGAGIGITPAADRTDRLHIVVAALIRDAEGRLVEKLSHDFPMEIPDDRLAAFKAGSFIYTRAITLGPGRYTVEAAVADREANQASVRSLEFVNPEHAGLALSDLLLVKKLEDDNGPSDAADPLVFDGKRALPELAGVVRASAHPFIYFMVYPDAAVEGNPRMEVEFSLGGRVVARGPPVPGQQLPAAGDEGGCRARRRPEADRRRIDQPVPRKSRWERHVQSQCECVAASARRRASAGHRALTVAGAPRAVQSQSSQQGGAAIIHQV